MQIFLKNVEKLSRENIVGVITNTNKCNSIPRKSDKFLNKIYLIKIMVACFKDASYDFKLENLVRPQNRAANHIIRFNIDVTHI